MDILTSRQKEILALFRRSTFLSTNFYFTGGTALSEYYLKHRYSDDLDFFCTSDFEALSLSQEIQRWADEAGFTFTSRNVVDTYIHNLRFKNGEELKVDFAKYPYKPVDNFTNDNGLLVDSQKDIAVNKTLVIGQRSEVKDFVDLYFLLQKYSIFDLHQLSNRKFHRDYDLMLLASDLLKVKKFENLPRMVKPLTLDELKSFFIDLASRLGLEATAD